VRIAIYREVAYNDNQESKFISLPSHLTVMKSSTFYLKLLVITLVLLATCLILPSVANAQEINSNGEDSVKQHITSGTGWCIPTIYKRCK
jgi:hypothetical protein